MLHGASKEHTIWNQRPGLSVYASICPPTHPTDAGSAPSFPLPNTLDPAASYLSSGCTLALSYSREPEHTHTHTHTHMHTCTRTHSSVFLGVALYPELRPSQQHLSVNQPELNGSAVPGTVLGAGHTAHCAFPAICVCSGTRAA